MKHTTEYLYGCHLSLFADMPYRQAIEFKLEQAKALIYSLMQSDYTERDDARVKAVFKAIKFNESLLEELNV